MLSFCMEGQNSECFSIAALSSLFGSGMFPEVTKKEKKNHSHTILQAKQDGMHCCCIFINFVLLLITSKYLLYISLFSCELVSVLYNQGLIKGLKESRSHQVVPQNTPQLHYWGAGAVLLHSSLLPQHHPLGTVPCKQRWKVMNY